MEEATEVATQDLTGFLAWSSLQRHIPLRHPFFADWDSELEALLGLSLSHVSLSLCVLLNAIPRDENQLTRVKPPFSCALF